MQVEYGGEFARQNPGVASDQQQREPLWDGEAKPPLFGRRSGTIGT